jgi:hypothetical protein
MHELTAVILTRTGWVAHTEWPHWGLEFLILRQRFTVIPSIPGGWVCTRPWPRLLAISTSCGAFRPRRPFRPLTMNWNQMIYLNMSNISFIHSCSKISKWNWSKCKICSTCTQVYYVFTKQTDLLLWICWWPTCTVGDLYRRPLTWLAPVQSWGAVTAP